MIEYQKEIGIGSYGAVYGGKNDSGEEVAIKRFFVNPRASFAVSIRELDSLQRLKGHPFIVELTDISFKTPFLRHIPMPKNFRSKYRVDDLHLIMELGAYDLSSLTEDPNVSLHYLKMAMVQLLLGTEYMHAKGIFHRDIKPKNLLWFRHPEGYRSVKIADFGLAKFKTDQEPQSPRVITAWYRSPEVAAQWSYDERCDIWSIGCILYEMITKSPLVSVEDDNRQIFYKILEVVPKLPDISFFLSKGTKRDDIERFYSGFNSCRNPLPTLAKYQLAIDTIGGYHQFMDLLTHLLDIDMTTRYSATEALNHPFFNDYCEYIDRNRKSHPPIPDPLPQLVIHNTSERRWAMHTIYTIYNKRGYFIWYSHRVIFNAIDLFDMYLDHLITNQTAELNSDGGFYLTKHQTEIRIMSCVYMMIKYHDNTNNSSFYDLIKVPYNPKLHEEVKQFEQMLIANILSYTIVRPTVFEVNDLMNRKITEEEVCELLQFYGKQSERHGITPLQLLKEFLDSRSHAISPAKISVKQKDTPNNLEKAVSTKANSSNPIMPTRISLVINQQKTAARAPAKLIISSSSPSKTRPTQTRPTQTRPTQTRPTQTRPTHGSAPQTRPIVVSSYTRIAVYPINMTSKSHNSRTKLVLSSN